MAWIWKTSAWGILIILELTFLGAQGKKEVSGAGVFYLGQDRDIWKPLAQTAVSLSEIRSIKSTFQLRTFDPEGAVFYGDTKDGEDWYVLALKDGFPLMQISKEGTLVTVTGGPKLNDGQWHTLEVSNEGKFVILVVDGVHPLIAGLQPKMEEEVPTGELRLAVGGILISKEKMLVPFKPQLDGCVRDGTWLNVSKPWLTDEDEMWTCHENIKPGSYFPGKGFIVFNISDFSTKTEQEINIEFWGEFNEVNGTICSIKNSGQRSILSLVADKNTNEVSLTFGPEKRHIKQPVKRLMITFQTEALMIHVDGSEAERLSVNDPEYSDIWTKGFLSIGGLLGDDGTGTQFLTGCLENIQVQGKNLDMGLAVTETSLYSYSCPA